MAAFNFILFMIFSSISRLVLVGFALFEKQIELNVSDLIKTILLGLLNDTITAFYILLFFSFVTLLLPKKLRSNVTLGYAFYLIIIFILCLLVSAEFTFWLEFNTRFNFIAVDYLIYTHEVIKNIIESYPLVKILGCLLALSFFILWILKLHIKKTIACEKHLSDTLKEIVTFLTLSILSFYLYDPKITDIKDNNYLSELSKDGLYNLFSAFKQNEIDYYNFYAVNEASLGSNRLFEYIKGEAKEIDPKILSRFIKGKGKKHDYNVFLITIESLSSEYLKENHNQNPLTPTLRELLNTSLYFNNLYAVGTRTVRGLEALSLSLPPLPGQSILRRKNNENLFSIATVLNKEEYDTKFIYGGYGYFDNMNYFFSSNGFNIIDRNDIPKSEATFSNAWGVSDEDLYNQAIKQADYSYQKNRKFFSLVMTTSNHRPYTYPDGKIDIPSKSGRAGGVKYTDYALGQFLKAAQNKPWFDNTIFVITADHCAGSAGKVGLPPDKYHIPLIIYAPKIIKPMVIDKLASQIDIAPTIIGLLNIDYESRFFGNDILSKEYQNAFISTFQKLGYIENNKLVILSPGKMIHTYALLEDKTVVATEPDNEIINRAIDYYQTTNYLYKNKLLKTETQTEQTARRD